MPSVELAEKESCVSEAPVDLSAVTKLVKSGLSFDLLCQRCNEIIRRDVRTERAAFYNAKRVTEHLGVCSGPKKRWWRRLFS
jgi:hypothetical protein